MIHKLKKRFTLLATLSMLLLMAVLVSVMNLINYSSVVKESDAVLEVLSQPDAPFMEKHELRERSEKQEKREKQAVKDFISRGMSPEIPYESRYFVVTVDGEGNVTDTDFSRILSVDQDSVEEYVGKVLERKRDKGIVDQFRYCKVESEEGTRILFLDWGRKIDAFHTFLWTSLSVGMAGCLVVFVVFLFLAGRIVKPIAESYEKQKRFISDAGHEIKTPLTIIHANLDLLECDGEKEELTEIRNQTNRLTTLTKDLVFLSKMEEAEHCVQKIECPVSDLIRETAHSFQAPAAAHGITYDVCVQPDVTMVAAPDALRQLVSVLLENAVKYTPQGGIITLQMSVQKKKLQLTVFNTTREKVSPEELPRLFDRFYRPDASRSSETGGHGIGLSIAQAIVSAHGGSITASTQDGEDFCIHVNLPI